jgi:hypothetical protein
MMSRRIFVPLDGTPAAAALPVAETLARARVPVT